MNTKIVVALVAILSGVVAAPATAQVVVNPQIYRTQPQMASPIFQRLIAVDEGSNRNITIQISSGESLSGCHITKEDGKARITAEWVELTCNNATVIVVQASAIRLFIQHGSGTAASATIYL